MLAGYKKTILIFSWFIALAFNQNLVISYFEKNDYSFHNIYFIIALVITIAIVIKIFLFIFGQRYFLKPIIIFLLILSSIVYYFNDKFNVLVNEDIIISAIHTFTDRNYNELNELLTIGFATTLLFLGVLPSIIVAKLKINYPESFLKETLQRGAIIIVCFAIVLIMAFSNYKNVSLIARKNSKILTKVIPTYTVSSIKNLVKNYLSGPTKFEVMDNSPKNDGKDDREIMILVVGETARAANFSLGGYERETNPSLKKYGIKYFKNATSCGTITAYSVPCMFYLGDYKSYKPAKAKYQQNVIDIINSTPNHQVVWFENNSSCKNVCDRVRIVDYYDKTRPEYKPGHHDEILVEAAKKMIAEYKKEDLLIVLHTIGSHGPRYHNRYPPEFEKFKPACKSDSPEKCTREHLINSYDNTIVFTDYIITQLIKILEPYTEQNAKVALLYVSDHGESLGEKNIYLHGLPNSLAPMEQRHVPVILWSNEFKNKEPIIIDTPITHEDIPGKLLSFFNIQTKIIKKTKIN